MAQSSLPPDQGAHPPVVIADRYRRSLLKLLAAYAGQHAELDRRIRSLTSLARRSPEDDTLPGLFENAVEVLIAQGLTAPRSGSATARLADLLAQPTAEGPVSEHTRHLRNRLRDASSRDETDRALSEVAALINALTEKQPYRQPSANEPLDTGLLDSLLDELRLGADAMGALNPMRERLQRSQSRPAQVDCARALGQAITGLLKTASDTQQQASSDLGLARTQLQHLLDKLTLPQPFAADKTQLRQQLATAGNPEDIHLAVDNLVDLLDRARGNTRQEMEELSSFLKVVSRRIEEFKGQVSHSGEAHDAAIASASSLQREMADQVADVCEALAEGEDLDTVKPAVITQLKDLESSLEDFVRTEQSRHGSASAQMELVVARLRELEAETQRLRNDLEQQHVLTLLDPLTGALNRLGYTESMGREYARWRRYGGQLSLAMCDLDLFKRINDDYGHAAGDKVLTSVAGLLRQQIRNCDLLCRLGGEEFAVILPETALEGARIAAEKLRANVAASKFRFKNSPVPVTISIGVAEFHAGDTIEDVFERADRALYMAKHQGRNRCQSERDLRPEDPPRGPPAD